MDDEALRWVAMMDDDSAAVRAFFEVGEWAAKRVVERIELLGFWLVA